MEHETFIAAILADPHDLEARLVFADYLEEIGDPRAELIRLQFEQQDLLPHDPLRKKLRTRELKLLRQHGKFGRLPPVAKELSAVGGFVDEIEITVQRFLKHEQEIFAGSPVRRIAFKGHSKKIAQLAKCRNLSNLVGLRLKNHDEDPKQFHELLTSSNLTHLEELGISGDWINGQILAALATHDNFKNLKSLTTFLPIARMGPPSDETLHTEPSPNRILDPGSLEFLADACFEKLQFLAVHGLSKPDVSPLTTSAWSAGLEGLWLVGAAVSRQIMLEVQSCANLSKLRRLKLSHGYAYYGENSEVENPVPDEAAIPELVELELVGNFGSSMIPNIIRNYPKLEVLRLSENQVGDEGIENLVESALFPKLRSLYLTNNRITVQGAERLGRARQKGLKLYLDGNNINYDEANYLREKFGKSFLSTNHFFYQA